MNAFLFQSMPRNKQQQPQRLTNFTRISFIRRIHTIAYITVHLIPARAIVPARYLAARVLHGFATAIILDIATFRVVCHRLCTRCICWFFLCFVRKRTLKYAVFKQLIAADSYTTRRWWLAIQTLLNCAPLAQSYFVKGNLQLLHF